MEKDIVIIKIVTGDEVIGRLEGENSEELRVKKPRLLVLTNEGSNLIPALIPWSPFIDDTKTISINKDTVVFVTKASNTLRNFYIEETSSIVVPGQK